MNLTLAPGCGTREERRTSDASMTRSTYQPAKEPMTEMERDVRPMFSFLSSSRASLMQDPSSPPRFMRPSSVWYRTMLGVRINDEYVAFPFLVSVMLRVAGRSLSLSIIVTKELPFGSDDSSGEADPVMQPKWKATWRTRWFGGGASAIWDTVCRQDS